MYMNGMDDDGNLGFSLRKKLRKTVRKVKKIAVKSNPLLRQAFAAKSLAARQRRVAPGSALVPVEAAGQQVQVVNSGVLPSDSTFFQQQEYPANPAYGEPLFPEQTSAAVEYPDSLLPNEPTPAPETGNKSNAGNLLKYGTIALLALKLLA